MPPRRMFAREVVDCIAEGHAPSDDERLAVVEHIREDLAAMRSAFTWSGPIDDTSSQFVLLRVADVALAGSHRG